MQFSAKDYRLIKELLIKLPEIEEQLKTIMDTFAVKNPRMEDFLTKINNQLKEFNMPLLMAKIKEL